MLLSRWFCWWHNSILWTCFLGAGLGIGQKDVVLGVQIVFADIVLEKGSNFFKKIGIVAQIFLNYL